jgi:phospholipase C
MSLRRFASPRVLVAAALAACAAAVIGWLATADSSTPAVDANTPIKHVVVIFDENVSFDHYFGTYPNATNPAGDPAFTAAPGTPAVDGLANAPHPNPNLGEPARIPRSQAVTCDQNHSYTNEIQAFDGGLMDRFVQFTQGGSCGAGTMVMNYYDGNTVTGLWNLAQHFTLSDGFYGSAFGPSTPGALELIAGTTAGAAPVLAGGIENGTMLGDPDPALDDCGSGSATMAGKNVGDLLNARGVTWGWFQGGFRRTAVSGAGKATCGASHANVAGGTSADYSAHHEPFMYYASTANQHHLPPTSVAAIGHTDQANHQYDLSDFDNAVKADNLPQVTFLKPASFEDAHPGNSGPLDEQRFLARTLDELQQSPDWASTAVVIAYDDSDGWYDHKQVVSRFSDAPSDGVGTICSSTPPPAGDPYLDRCGPGPRLPLLVISPWTQANAVNHTQIEQASITKFIEDNWSLGRVGGGSFDATAPTMNGLFDLDPGHARAAKVFLDPSTGQVLAGPPSGLTSSPNGADTTTTTPTPVVTTPAPVVTPPAAGTPTPVKPAPPAKLVIKPKLGKITAKRHGKQLALTLKVSGLSTKNGKATVTVKLVSHGKTVASSKAIALKSGAAKLTLKAKKTIKKGKYTLSVKVAQGTGTKTVTKTLTVR